jgi:hypothetical protein
MQRTVDLLGWVREAAAGEYEVLGEMGRADGARIYLAREQAGSRPLLLALRPAGSAADGSEQLTLEPYAALEPPEVPAGAGCPACGHLDPRGGRFCPACGGPVAEAARHAIRARARLAEAVHAQLPDHELIAATPWHEDTLFLARSAAGSLVGMRLSASPAADGAEEYDLEMLPALQPVLAELGLDDAGRRAARPGPTLTLTGLSLGFAQESLDRPVEPRDVPPLRLRPPTRVRRGRRFAWLLWTTLAATVVALVVVAVGDRWRAASGAPLGEPVDVGQAGPTPVSPAAPSGAPDAITPDSPPAASPAAPVTASVTAPVAAPPPNPAPIEPARPAAPPPKLPPECEAPVADRYPGKGPCYDRAPTLRVPSARTFPVPAGFTGTRLYDTELWVEVLANGRVRGTIVSGKSGDALLDREAERRAKALRFRPAVKGGRPVRTWYEIRMQPTR